MPVAAIVFLVGVGMMFTAAFLGEDHPQTPMLMVSGASVAFFAAGFAARGWDWQQDNPRRILRIAWAAFLLGLVLIAAAAVAFPGGGLLWALALACPGVYLTAFAAYTFRHFLNWWQKLLEFVAIFLMLVGAALACVGLLFLPAFLTAQPEPQALTLADLLEKGHGGNRHVKLKELQFCKGGSVSVGTDEHGFESRWYPVVVVEGAQAIGEDLPPLPNKIPALVLATVSEATGGPLEVELKGKDLIAMVANGHKRLGPKAEKQLAEAAPQTDFGQVVLLDATYGGKFVPSAGVMLATFGGGGAAVTVGLIVMLLLFRQSWRTGTPPPPAGS